VQADDGKRPRVCFLAQPVVARQERRVGFPEAATAAARASIQLHSQLHMPRGQSLRGGFALRREECPSHLGIHSLLRATFVFNKQVLLLQIEQAKDSLKERERNKKKNKKGPNFFLFFFKRIDCYMNCIDRLGHQTKKARLLLLYFFFLYF
jgi:hypothetical protein